MICRSAGLLLVLVAAPGQAAAHGGLRGGGGFYSGAAHPVLAIEQLLGLLALGLLLGQQGRSTAGVPLLALALTLCAGLVAATATLRAEPMMLGLALLLGTCVAAAPRVAPWGLTIAAALTGATIGFGTDAPASEPDLVATIAPYAGVFVGVFLIVLNAAAIASVARQPAFRIAVRVVGSWIAAIALMVLALRFRMMAGI